MTKLAVLSHAVPPMPSGQSVVLGRLLQPFERDRVILIVNPRGYGDRALIEREGRFPAYCLARDVPGHLSRILPARVLARARQIAEILRREGCGSIVACSGDILDLPAGFVASRLTGVPFYAYLFDDYLYQWPYRSYRLFVTCVEPFIMRKAAGCVVPNEFLRDEYRRRHRIEPIVIHNPTEPAEPGGPVPWPASPAEIGIVYTGAIYGAHYDAFRNLLAALELVDNPQLRLHIYTSQPQSELERERITGPVVQHPHQPQTKVPAVQHSADILFLPLAFDSPYPEEIVRTSAPGKMGEYLASGRPILVHAPPDAYVSWYFQAHNAGRLVDQPDPHALAEAIQQILDEPDSRKEWCQNARQRAQCDFSLETAQSKFVEMLGVT